MRRFSTQFTRPSIRVHAFSVISRTRAREVALSRAHETRRVRQRVVWPRRQSTPRKIVFPRAAPVADADNSSGLGVRLCSRSRRPVTICIGPYRWTVLGRVPNLATGEAGHVRTSSCYAFQPARFSQRGSVCSGCSDKIWASSSRIYI